MQNFATIWLGGSQVIDSKVESLATNVLYIVHHQKVKAVLGPKL
jgi:hypothetical protein